MEYDYYCTTMRPKTAKNDRDPAFLDGAGGTSVTVYMK